MQVDVWAQREMIYLGKHLGASSASLKHQGSPLPEVWVGQSVFLVSCP